MRNRPDSARTRNPRIVGLIVPQEGRSFRPRCYSMYHGPWTLDEGETLNHPVENILGWQILWLENIRMAA